MNHSLKVGFNFGVTSGIITTMGLMIGLSSATNSKLAIIGGILTIAIADACSDALGIHISEEGENKHTKKQIWQSTFSTFFFKFIFASMFIIPFLILQTNKAIISNVIIGFIFLAIFSYKLNKKINKKNRLNIVFEHLILAIFVIIVSYITGKIVNLIFK
ncbi:MAG: hypothetical protein QXW97_03355 [Candidatus Pacearchaeota archaeon]